MPKNKKNTEKGIVYHKFHYQDFQLSRSEALLGDLHYSRLKVRHRKILCLERFSRFGLVLLKGFVKRVKLSATPVACVTAARLNRARVRMQTGARDRSHSREEKAEGALFRARARVCALSRASYSRSRRAPAT